MIEVVEIVGIQRADSRQDSSECVALYGVNLAVSVLPKASYCVIHGFALSRNPFPLD